MGGDWLRAIPTAQDNPSLRWNNQNCHKRHQRQREKSFRGYPRESRYSLFREGGKANDCPSKNPQARIQEIVLDLYGLRAAECSKT